MGLDVYLYYAKDFDKFQELESLLEDSQDKCWERAAETLVVKDWHDAERKGLLEDYRMLSKEYQKETLPPLGFEVRDSPYERWSIPEEFDRKDLSSLPSVKYPDHNLFKLGYWRSSYNGSGIDSVLRNSIGVDLYSIVSGSGREDDGYYKRPDWNRAMERAKEILSLYRSHVEENGFYRVTEMSPNHFAQGKDLVSDESAALKRFLETKKEEHSFGSFSKLGGHYFFDSPLKVRGVFFGKNMFGNIAAYLVYETEENLDDWYLQALEIVVETCEYVISQPDPQNYFLGWSG